MSGRFDRQRWALFAVVIGMPLFWALNAWQEKRAASADSTSFSEAPAGLSAYFALSSELAKKPAASVRRPFLNAADLAPYRALVISSPRAELSDREGEKILEWTRAGGRLVLSIKDEAAAEALEDFLDEAKISAPLAEAPGYKSGKAEAVEASAEAQAPFEPGLSYDFYSRLRFNDKTCFFAPETCYARSAPLGKGRVFVFLGVPPFANGLVGRAANRRMAARLALDSGRTAFDEYHLWVTEKTMRDFLLDPAFSAPLLGLALGALLFLALGGDDEEERRAHAPKPKSAAIGLQDLGRSIIRRFLQAPGSLHDAALEHERMLALALPPSERAALERTAAPLKQNQVFAAHADARAAGVAYRMIQIHQKWLKSRGRS